MHACKGCINPGIFKKWKLYAEGKEKVEVDLNFEDILMHMRLTESTLKSQDNYSEMIKMLKLQHDPKYVVSCDSSGEEEQPQARDLGGNSIELGVKRHKTPELQDMYDS